MKKDEWIRDFVSFIYGKNENEFLAEGFCTDKTKNIIEKAITEMHKLGMYDYKDVFDIKKRFKRLSWLSDDFFSNILIHLRRTVYRKVEKRSVGACLVIAKKGSAFHSEELNTVFNKSVIQIEEVTTNDRLDKLDNLGKRYYELANSETFIFVYTEDANFQGIYYYKNSETLSQYDKLKKLTQSNAEIFALFVESDKNCIRMFFYGKHIADYYLKESTGQWYLRFVEDIENYIRILKLNDKASTYLSSVILRLSYEKTGAILAFTKEKLKKTDDYKNSDININPMYFGRENCSSQIFEFAMKDGAVLLHLMPNGDENDAMIYETSAILSQTDTPKVKACKSEKKQESFGSRHNAARSLASKYKDAAVFVISENRGISFFYDGKELMLKDEILEGHEKYI